MMFLFAIQPSWACINPRFGSGKGKAVYARTLESMSLMVLSQRHDNKWGKWAGRLEVEVVTYWADERGGDVDSTLKCVLDALQKGGAIDNDKSVARLIAHRLISKDSPRIEVVVRKLPEVA